MKIIIQSIKTIIITLLVGLSAVYAVAWTGPSIPPPDGNTPTPINSGLNTSTKAGDLSIQGYYVVRQNFETYDDTFFAAVEGGVGLGTRNPIGKLDVQDDEVRIWDGSASVDIATSRGELYVENDLEVDGRICLSNECRSSWPSGVVTPWVTSGSNVYYNSGNVGIGTVNPQSRLDVRGDEVRIWDGYASVGYANTEGDLYVENDLEVDGRICLRGVCKSVW